MGGAKDFDCSGVAKGSVNAFGCSGIEKGAGKVFCCSGVTKGSLNGLVEKGPPGAGVPGVDTLGRD